MGAPTGPHSVAIFIVSIQECKNYNPKNTTSFFKIFFSSIAISISIQQIAPKDNFEMGSSKKSASDGFEKRSRSRRVLFPKHRAYLTVREMFRKWRATQILTFLQSRHFFLKLPVAYPRKIFNGMESVLSPLIARSRLASARNSPVGSGLVSTLNAVSPSCHT